MAAKNIQMDDVLKALDQAFKQSTFNKSNRAIVLLAFNDNLRGCKNFDHVKFMGRATNLPSYNAE
jgi:hypothetical protein